MPIDEAEIEYRLSGGAANVDPAASLGGVMSAAAGGIIASGNLHNLFDPVTGDQAAAGHIDYRGIYVRNIDAALIWQAVKAWIKVQSSSPDTDLAIAVADEAGGVAMEVIANELTPPVGPAFSAPANKAAGLNVGDLDPNEFRGIWIRRTVAPGADPANDSATLRCEGDTNP